MAKPDKFEEQYWLLMNAVADSVMDMSQEDIEKEYGSDPQPDTMNVFKAALKTHSQAKLRAAKTQYEEANKALTARVFVMPSTKEERRALLDAVLASQIAMSHGQLTAQFRDLTSESDSDVESTLRQLDALGILQKFREQNNA